MKLFSRDLFTDSILTIAPRRTCMSHTTWGVMHAHRDGSPVLKSDSSWRTVSGVMISTPKRHVAIQFRGWK